MHVIRVSIEYTYIRYGAIDFDYLAIILEVKSLPLFKI